MVKFKFANPAGSLANPLEDSVDLNVSHLAVTYARPLSFRRGDSPAIFVKDLRFGRELVQSWGVQNVPGSLFTRG